MLSIIEQTAKQLSLKLRQHMNHAVGDFAAKRKANGFINLKGR